jgi:anti-anti-sigma factor
LTDSCGARLIWQSHERLLRGASRLVVIGGNAAVHRTFEICGLADWLRFVGDPAASGASVSSPRQPEA